MRRTAGVLVVAAVSGVILWPTAFTVVPIGQDVGAPVAFNAVTYVDDVWDEIQTTIRTDAVDLGELLTAIPADKDGFVPKGDLVAVTRRLGVITPGEAHVYRVRATGTVARVNTATSVGTLELQPAGYEGTVTVEVYLGPRIPSDDSSVRDAVGFLSFGEFRDQTEYGKVASEINGRVIDAMASVDRRALPGATVTVFGALTIRTFNLLRIDVGRLRVVPVAIEVAP